VSSSSAPSVSSEAASADPTRMTGDERRAGGALALVFALRMLGLFIVLPVFALEAARLPGGDDPARVGSAMGLYGLTQAFLQIPFGIASDRFGRKPTIVAGLLVFAAGSAIAAWAPDLTWLAAGRAVQGAGAISAAVTAFLADVTRDSVRTKAMAMVGASIALMFALSLVIAPLLAGWVGLPGIFLMTCSLALLGIAVVLWVAPPEPVVHKPSDMQQVRGGLAEVLRHPGLLRLNLGVFVLHAVQLAMWMALPAMLVQAGLPKAAHWQVYLPAVAASLLVMGGVLFPMERKGQLRVAFLVSIGLILAVQLAVGGRRDAQPGRWVLLFVFFIGFNTMKPASPAWVQARTRAGRRSVCTTRCSRWASSWAARWAAGWPVRTAPAGCLRFVPWLRWCGWWWPGRCRRRPPKVEVLAPFQSFGGDAAWVGGMSSFPASSSRERCTGPPTGGSSGGGAPGAVASCLVGAGSGVPVPAAALRAWCSRVGRSIRLDSVPYSGRLIRREIRLASIAAAIRLSTIGRPSIISMTMMNEVSGACVVAARKPAMPMAIRAGINALALLPATIWATS
jgi:MFS family permease